MNKKYKGHTIEMYESPVQRVYVIDGNKSKAYWSLAEARRAINGNPVLFEPVSIERSDFFLLSL